MTNGRALLVAMMAALVWTSARAECMSDTAVAALFDSYNKRQPVANPVGLSIADAECTREKLNALLQAQMGAPVGYKAGLTNPAVQRRFQHDSPVWGTLYAPMLLRSGAAVDAAFGARLGVLGTPIAARKSAGFANALRDMVTIVKVDGTEIDRGKGSDVLGHPLNAVAWLARDMARSGKAMRKGDLISLGSFSRLLPPKPGLAVEVIYEGLPGHPSVTVAFH